MKQILSQPFDQWQVEEIDIILSIIPAGSFARMQTGSEALYKDTQRVIILGFAHDVKEEEDLNVLSDEQLKNYKQTINCTDPAK